MTSTSVIRWRRPCIWWTRPDWHNIIRSKRKVSTATFSERARCSPSSASQNGVHLLRTAAHRTPEQHPDARTGHSRTAQTGAAHGEQPARAAHRELAHAAEQGHRAEDKEQLLKEERP